MHMDAKRPGEDPHKRESVEKAEEAWRPGEDSRSGNWDSANFEEKQQDGG